MMSVKKQRCETWQKRGFCDVERFIQFNDETVNSALWMELTDLSAGLSRQADAKVEYGPLSYWQSEPPVAYVSHFWHHRPVREERAGMKTDLYLHAFGTVNWTSKKAVRTFLDTRPSSFARQVLAAAEDIRLEQLCVNQRPGTAAFFRVRNNVLRRYHREQLTVNRTKGFFEDALFNTLMLLWLSDTVFDWPDLHEAINQATPFLDRTARLLFDARSTDDVAYMVRELADVTAEFDLRPMVNQYSHLPDLESEEAVEAADPGRRVDPLVNDDKQESAEGDSFDEDFSTWHRESEETTGTFLQFELEQGTKTPMMGNGAREGEEGDAAMASVQGNAKQTKQSRFPQLEADQREEDTGAAAAPYGKENIGAEAVIVPPRPASPAEREAYRLMKQETEPAVQKLKRLMDKTMEKKRTSPRSDLKAGRLGKKLLPFFTDSNPRLFFKKQSPSREINAVFYLLIDSSASMFDKMEDVKKSAVLFHETLAALRVAHEITAFWENADPLSKTVKPNHFLTAVPFHASLQKGAGEAIGQLQPEEDNRDGFAIRKTIEKLEHRQEERKFLLVFSDGEPSAADYDRNGVLDTHEAVLLARKKGIAVFNLFLGSEALDEARQKTMKTIYGHGAMMVPDVAELPHVLAPVLRKLLVDSI